MTFSLSSIMRRPFALVSILPLLVFVVGCGGSSGGGSDEDRDIQDLVFSRSFAASSPDGIAYDPGSDTLFTVDSSSNQVCQYTIQGSQIACFTRNEGGFPEGIDVLQNGNLVIVDEADNQITEYTQSGSLVSTATLPAGNAPNGVVFHTGTGSFFNTDDNDRAIYEFDADSLLNMIDFSGTATEPEGIDFDPMTGNLYVVADDEGMLYEITVDGGVESQLDLVALTGFDDPEGVAYDGTTQTFFIAFDNNERVAVLSY